MNDRNLLLQSVSRSTGPVSPWLVSLCGAFVGFALALVLESLGVADTIGVSAAHFQLLFTLIGLLVARTRFGVNAWFVLGAAVTLNLLVTWTPLVQSVVPHFVRTDAPARTDIIVVLSGGISPDGLLHEQSLDRLLSAFALAKERNATQLALSVTTTLRGGRPLRSESDQRQLAQLFAPTLRLYFVDDVHSTRDEAIRFAELARKEQWHSVTLVTSPMHSARACATLEHVGLVVECHPAAPRDYSVRTPWQPESRRRAFADILYEVTATIVYRLRGWI